MNGYVAAGYLSTAGLLGLYAWRVLRRGRVLARVLGSRAGGLQGDTAGAGTPPVAASQGGVSTGRAPEAGASGQTGPGEGRP